MFGRDSYAVAPWGGATLPPLPVNTLPPPIPGDPATFSYANNKQVARPWAYLAWAGGYPPSPYPGGGILTHPDEPAGVVRINAWWPDAALLHMVRIGPDGSRTPVRGAYPLTVNGFTRRNLCTNPSIEVGANGYVPADGNPTLTRTVGADAADRTAYLRVYSGVNTVIGTLVPTALAGLTLTTTVTVGMALRTRYLPTSVTVSIAWVDGVGAALSTSSLTLNANENAAVTGQFSRIVKQFTVPAGAANGSLKVVADAFASNFLDLDAIMVETGVTDGSYADGDLPHGTWLGTPGLSASVVAPEQVVLDAECPLDTLVTYEVAYQAITGGAVTSTPPVILHGTQGSWITHPARPGSSLRVELASVPRLERTVPQGVFLPVGAQRPVVVSAARRQAPTTTLEFVTLSFAERDALLDLLADAHPLLLRFPAEYGYSAPMWFAFGRVTEDRGERKAFHDTVILEAEATEVNSPAVVV